ncbi:MAG: hypothetical protein MJ175_08525 [Clostridia bacterium]|nr:hypothetical protein [Clostridia bacterium]
MNEESKTERETDADGQYLFDIPETLMGVYLSPGIDGAEVEDAEGSDYINAVIVSAFDDYDFTLQIRLAIKNGNAFWINTQFLETGFFENNEGQREMGVREDWQERMDALAVIIRREKAWNYFLGFYMDEPLLNRFTAERVYALSKYNHDTFSKRYFICFSVEEIVPSEYSDHVAYGRMTKEYSVYVTDAAYDMYWDYDEWSAKYKSINEKMKKELPDDVRIWYIPWAYSYNDKTFEEVAALEPKLITHLNAMYDFLMAEEHKGGLMTFCWRGSRLGFYGMEELIAENEWMGYFDRFREIGKSLCEH